MMHLRNLVEKVPASIFCEMTGFTEPVWTQFPRKPTRKGLRGVKLISPLPKPKTR